MRTERATMYGLLQVTRESFREAVEYGHDLEEQMDILRDPGDTVSEVADSSVPVYTGDLMQLAANTLSLAVDEPECGPAFDGTPTPVNIIAANVYEALTADLYEYATELKEEIEAKIEVREEAQDAE